MLTKARSKAHDTNFAFLRKRRNQLADLKSKHRKNPEVLKIIASAERALSTTHKSALSFFDDSGLVDHYMREIKKRI